MAVFLKRLCTIVSQKKRSIFSYAFLYNTLFINRFLNPLEESDYNPAK